jgi:hypothetical protein
MSSPAVPAAALDPLEVLRAFCQADGNGARLRASTWPAVAPLVAWGLEPAWDQLYLIHGYEIGTPSSHDGAIIVDVQYNLAQSIRSGGAKVESRIATRRYTSSPTASAAGACAAAAAAHVFASQADPDALVAAAVAGRFDLPEQLVVRLAPAARRRLRPALRRHHRPADRVRPAPRAHGEHRRSRALLLRRRAVHVAMVESDDGIVSATLNAGLRRSPFGAFAGEIRYLRPVSAADLPRRRRREQRDPDSTTEATEAHGGH